MFDKVITFVFARLFSPQHTTNISIQNAQNENMLFNDKHLKLVRHTQQTICGTDASSFGTRS